MLSIERFFLRLILQVTGSYGVLLAEFRMIFSQLLFLLALLRRIWLFGLSYSGVLVEVCYRWTFFHFSVLSLVFWWARFIKDGFYLKGLEGYFLFWKSKNLSSCSMDIFLEWEGPMCLERLFLSLLIKRDSSFSSLVDRLLRLSPSKTLPQMSFCLWSSWWGKFLEKAFLLRLTIPLGQLWGLCWSVG